MPTIPASTSPEMLSKINQHFFPGKERVLQTFFHIKGEIDQTTCADAIDEILSLNIPAFEHDEEEDVLVPVPPPDVINLLITTPGGDMSACFALINVIKGSKIPVRTIALGEASSAGFCILMAGHQRVVTPYTSLMSHCFRSGFEGTYHEITNMTKEFHRYHEKMLAFYHEYSNMDPDFIREHFLGLSDMFVSHEDALKHGIVDLISDLS